MNVLAVLEGAVETCDQGDIPGKVSQGLHSRGQLQGVDARLVLDPLLVLELVGVEAADKTGQHSVLFTREETTAHNSVGDIHDHQLLGGLAPLPGFTGNRIRNRTQKG